MIRMSPGDHLSPAVSPCCVPACPHLRSRTGGSGFILLLPPRFPLGKDTQAQGPCQQDTGNVGCGTLHPGSGGAPHAGRTPVQAPQGWVLQSLALPVNANGVLEAGMLGAAALFSSSGQKSHHILPGKNCP